MVVPLDPAKERGLAPKPIASSVYGRTIARHPSVELTMKGYADPTLLGLRGAVERTAHPTNGPACAWPATRRRRGRLGPPQAAPSASLRARRPLPRKSARTRR